MLKVFFLDESGLAAAIFSLELAMEILLKPSDFGVELPPYEFKEVPSWKELRSGAVPWDTFLCRIVFAFSFD
jgi:hypothetical protein